MVPLARLLQQMGNNIIIGSGKLHQDFFRTELQGLTYLDFSGFSPGYSRFLPQYIALFLKIPQLVYHIILEHIRLKKIIRENDIDIIISDNRFGLWNKKITSVYVTHMPLIPFPGFFKFLEFTGVILHRSVIKKYSMCLIPDLPGEMNISGRLSHGMNLPANTRYTGIMSRFMSSGGLSKAAYTEFRHNTVILSGPEPQRKILKRKLTELLKEKDIPGVILEGNPDKPGENSRSGNIHFYSHLPADEMKMMITGSDSIISRSGYTTIMELISLNRTALLIPTPGQTEQEYLSEYLTEKGWFSTISQHDLNKGVLLAAGTASWPEEIIEQSRVLMTEAINELLENHHKKS